MAKGKEVPTGGLAAKELLAALRLRPQGAAGSASQPEDPGLLRQMALARLVMRQRRVALRELA